jgi:hypothetical protein
LGFSSAAAAAAAAQMQLRAGMKMTVSGMLAAAI